MTRDLSRLFRPKSIAVIGGGEWCRQVILQCEKMGYDGVIWPVHPKGGALAGHQVYTRLEELPAPPDAAFVGINRNATIEAINVLSSIGAGGAVCFASGFSEAAAEDASGASLQDQLVKAAGDMPILGPNCYGFVNALDGALLWPDQHGCGRVDKGVAILTQSSNIAINLTMQQRALPIAYTVTCGNMAQTTQAEIATGLLDDERVTAIGLHIEGFSELRAWEILAQKAHVKGVPLIALKVGRSQQAQAATVSHTASLAGGDVGAQALLNRLGIPRLDDLTTFLETLKLLHVAGPLADNTLASVSCSGGEASLAADTAHGRGLVFPPLNDRQKTGLRAALGPKVALANPLDYHTYIWRDTEAMTEAFSAITDPGIALTMLIVDYPHTDATDWTCATQAALATRAATGHPVAIVSTLPELLPTNVAETLMAGSVIPLQGLTEAISAAEAASSIRAPVTDPLLLPGAPDSSETLTEAQSKAALAAHGLIIPRHVTVVNEVDLSTTDELTPPLVLKGQGIAHKSEAGAVALNLTAGELAEATALMPTNTFLIEEMVQGGVAELLIGITRDPAHGFVLTLAAGGVMTELLADSTSLLVPASRNDMARALSKLKTYKLLTGFRGKPAANIDAVLNAGEALQSYALANAASLEEVEVNPLICTPDTAIAADALIRKAP
ncbi:acetate--CoA ligase family protein [Alisedimentitalea sp. MJ-SS2]|uniref:acetate--CoA ligase family protein n=1 Tax=Aliisedimentitalea sp. MJ-SS2 TaxID=3049795 RepID=UPI002911E5F7|nr:acetate--CoA ligase family protein [Alisedimentitalea sp. MJ-SS2]MDU8927723.1 acetate--CoA ligase family protein [Alisedimentitalea sp. MJ-SS2]